MVRWLRRSVSVVLKAVGHSGSTRYYIEYTPGFQPPEVVEEAESYYYSNRSGSVVRHPSAYALKGWSSLVYHSANKGKIVVGQGWVIEHLI